MYYFTSTYNLRSLTTDPSGNILADAAGKPGAVFPYAGLDAPRYQSLLSMSGEAEFRHLWAKERRPFLRQRLTRDL